MAETAEAAWQNAQKRQRVTSVPARIKGESALALRLPAANSKGPTDPANSDDDDDLFEAVWGRRVAPSKTHPHGSDGSCGAEEEQGAAGSGGPPEALPGARQGRKRTRAATTQGTATLGPTLPATPGTALPATPGTAVPRPPGMPRTAGTALPATPFTVAPGPSPQEPSTAAADAARKRAKPVRDARGIVKEMDAGEQVCLLCRQTLGNLADDATCTTITPKAFLALLAKLQARLAPEMVRTYSQDYAGGPASTRGMQLLEDLRKHHAVLPKLQNLVECMHAVEGAKASSSTLLEEVRRAEDAGVAVAPLLREMAVARAATEAANSGRFADCAGLLLALGPALPGAALPGDGQCTAVPGGQQGAALPGVALPGAALPGDGQCTAVPGGQQGTALPGAALPGDGQSTAVPGSQQGSALPGAALPGDGQCTAEPGGQQGAALPGAALPSNGQCTALPGGQQGTALPGGLRFLPPKGQGHCK